MIQTKTKKAVSVPQASGDQVTIMPGPKLTCVLPWQGVPGGYFAPDKAVVVSKEFFAKLMADPKFQGVVKAKLLSVPVKAS